jgi:hypothetical protein
MLKERRVSSLLERRVVQRDQSAQSFVGLSGHFDSGDHFLADVTTLFVIDRALFQICFDRNNLVRKFAAQRGSPCSIRYIRSRRIDKQIC